MKIIPTTIRKIWSKEEIRTLILLSLFFQTILIFFSLFRKRSRNKALNRLLWLSYLGADAIAMLALGNLLSEQNDEVEANTSGDIKAFWAPFLLLHLGGPDTITSYSLEDNELWFRHLLNLVAHVVVAVIVFLESLPSPHVWKSAIVVFAAGILKYGERTASLRSASMENLRKSMLGEADPGPNYAKFMQELNSRTEAAVKVEMMIKKEAAPPLTLAEAFITEAEVISMGYHFFQTLKRLTVNLMLSFKDRMESQNFFFQRNAKQAFQVVEVEFSFLHDILHTKAVHVHNTRGLITRIASLAMAILAFLLFYHDHRSGNHSHVFESVDVLITYLLLLVAIGLEIVAILLHIFSDWAIVALQISSSDRLKKPWIAYLKKKLRMPIWGNVIIHHRQRFLSIFPVWLVGDTERWWSNKMRQFNLIEVCLRDYKRPNLDRMLELVKLIDVRNQWWNVKSIQVDDAIKEHIFDQLKLKVRSTDGLPENYKRLRACRGEWVLREKGYIDLKWSIEKDFDESILIWHIATYLCQQKHKADQQKTVSNYAAEKVWRRKNKLRSWMKSIGRIMQMENTILRRSLSEKDDSDSSASVMTADDESTLNDYIEISTMNDYIEISRKISEYLIYLVVYQPKLLPAGIGRTRFIDMTCAEAKKFFSDKATEMREELENIRSAEGEKKKTRKDYFCVSTIKNSFGEAIRKWWTAIDKILLLKKIHQFFCFCIGVAKEMQPKNKQVTPEMEWLGCEKLIEVRMPVNPIEVKGDRSQSVLFDAVKLARQIMENFRNDEEEEKNENKNKEEKMWEVVSSVWVEMLCFAAGNGASDAHCRQLSQGGELLTHVWLLMTHMGIRVQYRIEASQS